MDNVAPSLVLTWDVMWALERGQPVTYGVQCFLKREDRNLFKHQIEMWWAAQKNPALSFDKRVMNATRRQLLHILELGLHGESILAQLKLLEAELLLSCDEEIQQHAALLPLKMMVPLFGLIFPSLLLLLISPLLRMLQF